MTIIDILILLYVMEEKIQSMFCELADYEISLISSLDAIVLMFSDDKAYIPKLEDVGDYLVVRWVPARKDGKLGKSLIARSRLAVAPG